MSKNIKIKQVPSWAVYLRILPNDISIALAPYVFLNKYKYEDYKTGSPECHTEAIIEHERVHVKRQQAMGLWKFLFLYLFVKSFCLNEEIEAIKEEMKVYRARGVEYNIERRARSLSTFWLYHHCISFDDAKKQLDVLWRQT